MGDQYFERPKEWDNKPQFTSQKSNTYYSDSKEIINLVKYYKQKSQIGNKSNPF